MKCTLSLVLSLLLFDAAAAPAQRVAQAPAPVHFELPNGLRVWVQEDHTRPMVLVQTTYKVGSINDAPGQTGTAHYVEHMVYRATQNIRNEDIYGFVDRVGGRYTGGTAALATTYTETVPSWGLEEALHTNAERMGRALFDRTEMERERDNVITEANGYVLTTAARILQAEVMSASFEVHPYRQSSATWAQDNLLVTRDQAYAFYTSYYGPNNVVLAVVGDVSPDEVRRLVTQQFGSLTPAPLSGAVTIVEPPQRVEKRVTLTYPDDQAHLDLVYRAPQASHPDYPVLVVLDRVLSTRLNKATSAAGIAEITTAHSATPYPQVYRFTATTAVAGDLEKMVGVIQGEIERIAREGVPAGELDAARVAPPGQGGRGGRGRGGGGGGGGGGLPPRQSNLTQIATQLTAREVFAWDVGAAQLDSIRVAQARVTSADIQAYADRWLRNSQRTVGFHIPGKSNYAPQWATGREVVGERLVIPAQVTQPAKRMRPDPVPAKALEPMAALPLLTGKSALSNGVVVRVAKGDAATAAVFTRVQFGASADPGGKEGLSLLVARLIGADPGLQSLGATTNTTPLTNDGYFDIRVAVPAGDVAAAAGAVAHALNVRSFSGDRIEAERAKMLAELTGGAGNMGRGGRGGGGGGGRGAGVAAEARNRVVQAVAPLWHIAGTATRESIGRITSADVGAFAVQRLKGGAMTVAVVGPSEPLELLNAASLPFSALPEGHRVGASPSAAGMPQPGSLQEERTAIPTEPQVTVEAGLPGALRSSPDRRALELLNYIVGVPSYGGRLGWALTKAGFTYSSSATTTFGAITGHIVLSTKCDTKNLESTIQAVREIVAGVGERGVDDWELAEAKSFTFGRTLLYGTREDSGEEAIAAALLDSELSGEELLDLPAFSRNYLAVTLDQINAAAKKYYRPELLKVVAVGAIPGAPGKSPFPAGSFRALFEK